MKKNSMKIRQTFIIDPVSFSLEFQFNTTQYIFDRIKFIVNLNDIVAAAIRFESVHHHHRRTPAISHLNCNVSCFEGFGLIRTWLFSNCILTKWKCKSLCNTIKLHWINWHRVIYNMLQLKWKWIKSYKKYIQHRAFNKVFTAAQAYPFICMQLFHSLIKIISAKIKSMTARIKRSKYSLNQCHFNFLWM